MYQTQAKTTASRKPKATSVAQFTCSRAISHGSTKKQTRNQMQSHSCPLRQPAHAGCTAHREFRTRSDCVCVCLSLSLYAFSLSFCPCLSAACVAVLGFPKSVCIISIFPARAAVHAIFISLELLMHRKSAPPHVPGRSASIHILSIVALDHLFRSPLLLANAGRLSPCCSIGKH